jgi:rRNA maturation endonuclease Nob1
MRKNPKKLSKTVRKQLQFLVEEFLEKSGTEIAAKIGGHGDAAKTMWEKLEGSLFDDIFWMDEIDSEDMAEIDYENLLMEYHAFLKPIWEQFRKALFDYKFRIMPERAKLQKARETIDRDKDSLLSEYKELLKQDTVLDWEKVYDITLTVSFEPGHVTFYKRSLNVIKNIMDLLSVVDIEYFARCEHCGKCIIVSRANKRFCPGCGAKKFQKDKWQQDPEGMREKERVRYREKRKKS